MALGQVVTQIVGHVDTVWANIHLGGADRVLRPVGGGGVVAEIFRDPYSGGGGGGVVAEIFRARFCGSGTIFSVSYSNIP